MSQNQELHVLTRYQIFPKRFTVLLNFNQIVDKTSTYYQNAGSYLTELLNPLKQNKFMIRYSFDADNKIKLFPPEVFDDRYIFFSFDVELLLAISANNKLYQHISLLEKTIMSKMKKIIIKKFIDEKILLFYELYVSNTLFVFKQEHLKLVDDASNNFEKNLSFLFVTFYNVVPHFFTFKCIHID